MVFWDLFPKTSQRPPIYLRNEMTGFKKNTYFLTKRLIFNENIGLTQVFCIETSFKTISPSLHS